MPSVSSIIKSKKGETWELLQMTFHTNMDTTQVSIEKDKGDWFLSILNRLIICDEPVVNFEFLKQDYEKKFDDFELFWYSKSINTLRESGLLVL